MLDPPKIIKSSYQADCFAPSRAPVTRVKPTRIGLAGHLQREEFARFALFAFISGVADSPLYGNPQQIYAAADGVASSDLCRDRATESLHHEKG